MQLQTNSLTYHSYILNQGTPHKTTNCVRFHQSCIYVSRCSRLFQNLQYIVLFIDLNFKEN